MPMGRFAIQYTCKLVLRSMLNKSTAYPSTTTRSPSRGPHPLSVGKELVTVRREIPSDLFNNCSRAFDICLEQFCADEKVLPRERGQRFTHWRPHTILLMFLVDLGIIRIAKKFRTPLLQLPSGRTVAMLYGICHQPQFIDGFPRRKRLKFQMKIGTVPVLDLLQSCFRCIHMKSHIPARFS